MTERDKMLELEEAYGAMEADRMIIQTFGTIDAAYQYAIQEGIIEMTISHPELVAKLVKPGADILATMTPEKMNLLHAAIGISGEVAELQEAFLGDPPLIDRANVVEEVGDALFYMEQANQALGDPIANISSRDCDARLLAGITLGAVVVYAGTFLDLVKKVAVYNSDKVDDRQLRLALVDCAAALASWSDDHGITYHEATDANIAKLSKRYADGYSDAAAQARADKAAE